MKYNFSACSGFMGAVFGTPADVVKTRYMNQPFAKNGRHVVSLFVVILFGVKYAIVLRAFAVFTKHIEYIFCS